MLRSQDPSGGSARSSLMPLALPTFLGPAAALCHSSMSHYWEPSARALEPASIPQRARQPVRQLFVSIELGSGIFVLSNSQTQALTLFVQNIECWLLPSYAHFASHWLKQPRGLLGGGRAEGILG